MATREDKLRRFAREHLLYEVEMLHSLTARLLEVRRHDTAARRRDLGWLDIETRNAQVESFALHARALILFLYERKGKRDDALASHYVGEEWDPPTQAAELQAVRQRVGREIAHLTYKRNRLVDDARNWEYARLWDGLKPPLRAFTAEAPPTLLPPDVARRINEMTEPRLSSENFYVYAASATNSLTT